MIQVSRSTFSLIVSDAHQNPFLGVSKQVETLGLSVYVLCYGIWQPLRQPSLMAILEPAPMEMFFEITKDAYLGFPVFSGLAIFSSVVCWSFEAGVRQSPLVCSTVAAPAWVPALHAQAHSQVQPIESCRFSEPKQYYILYTILYTTHK